MDDVSKTGSNKAAEIANVDSTKENLNGGMETSSIPQQEIKVHIFNINNSVVSVINNKIAENCYMYVQIC